MRLPAGLRTGRDQAQRGQLHAGATDLAAAAIAAWHRHFAAAATSQPQPRPALPLTVERRLYSTAIHEHSAAAQPSLQPTPPAARVAVAHGCCIAADRASCERRAKCGAQLP